MRYDSLQLLRCPACKGELSVKRQADTGLIQEGGLYSQECGRSYPIIEGIPRFIAASELVGLNSKYERLYNWISRFYDSEFFIASQIRDRFLPEGEDKGRREVVGRLEIKPDSQVLETGIGTGDNIPYIASYARGARVYGLDISVGMLNQCIRNLKKWNLETELFLGNAEELPFKDESFDVVFHLGAINVFTDQKKGIDEMVRVAKSGTKIVIVDETEKAADTDPFSRLGWSVFFGRREYESMLEFRPTDILKQVSPDMVDVRLDTIWQGMGYRLEFKKP